MGELGTNIQYLGGVGPKRAELLRRELGVETLEDLIHLYPHRYVDRSGITLIAEARPELASLQIRARVVGRTLYGRIRPSRGRQYSKTAETSTGRTTRKTGTRARAKT